MGEVDTTLRNLRCFELAEAIIEQHRDDVRMAVVVGYLVARLERLERDGIFVDSVIQSTINEEAFEVADSYMRGDLTNEYLPKLSQA